MGKMTEKEIIYIDMDGVLCDYDKAFADAIKSKPFNKIPQSEYGFFENLEPFSGAIDSVLRLQELFDVYILTSPSVKNPLCYTEKRNWIENHLGIGMLNKFIISPNKGLNKGKYLIDDNTEGKKQELFEGELIHFSSDKFPNWKAVISYLENKKSGD